MRPDSGIAIQLERCTKRLSTICRADVIDVARVATSSVPGINVMHDAVEGSGLTPTLMSPVATAIGKHAGEVAHSGNPRPRKARAGVRVGPRIAAVGRPEEEIRVIVRKAAVTFGHACDVHIACGKVAGNLDIADKRRTAGDLPRVGPSKTIVSGIANEERTTAHIEVVPRNVHSPIEWRGRIVVSPARFAVVLVVIVNAKMSPAIRAPRRGGLVSAETLTSAAPVQPDSEPGARWSIVQNNRIAKGVRERALATGVGETGKVLPPSVETDAPEMLIGLAL